MALPRSGQRLVAKALDEAKAHWPGHGRNVLPFFVAFQDLDRRARGLLVAGRAADRPLQPIVRPPSLTHIAQVCGSWTIKSLVNAKLRRGLA